MPRENEVFEFGGYAMRSHSETRWASMMDCLGIRWLYETKVYQTRHGGYLPDFYLPDAGVFVEVKGPKPSQIEIEKGLDVERKTGCPVIFAYGKPELDGFYLIHAVLEYFGFDGPYRFSLYEVCQGIEARQGLRSCALFAHAGAILERPSCVSLSQLLQERIDSWRARADIENEMAANTALLNSQKYLGDIAPNLQTMCLVHFAGMASKHRKAEVAL